MPESEARRNHEARKVRSIASAVRLLFSKSDALTEHGRAAERRRRALLTIASGAVGRGTTIVCGLVSVPLAMGHLGVERYGVWLTMNSLLAFAAVADFGVGDGMMSALGRATGKDDADGARIIVSSGVATVLLFAAFGGLVFAAAFPFVDWAAVFNVTGAVASREVGGAVAVGAACFFATMVFGVVGRINRGLQRGYVNHLWQSGGTIVMLALLFFASKFEAGLVVLVAVLAGTPVVALVAMSVWMAARGDGAMAIDAKSVQVSAARRLLGSGAWFMLLGVGYLFVMGVTNVIVAHRIGIASVAEAGVPMRLFGVVGLVVSMLVTPLWPAFAEADARGDRRWLVRTALMAVAGASVLGFVVSGMLAVFGREVIHLWVGSLVVPAPGVLAALGVWSALASTSNALGVIVAGIGMEKWDAILRILQAAVLAGGQWVVAPLHGVSGMLWVLAASEVLFRTVPLGVVVSRALSRGLGVAGRELAVVRKEGS